jgi:preprotein translocase subunit SecE
VNKVMDSMRTVRLFLGDVRNELRKSTWPTRSELLESTVVVIISVVLFAVFVSVCDTLLGKIIGLLAR